MKAFWKYLLPVFLLAAATRPLPAAGVLFTFQGDAAVAAVHDADSLRLLANPPVGFAASEVFGIPNPAAPHGFQKFFVLGRDAVVVLDSEFNVHRTLPLSEPLSPGSGSGVLIQQDSRLLLAAGRQIVVIDTTQESVLTTVQLGFAARALALLRDPQRVFVVAEGAVLLREIDLQTWQIKESAAVLPQAMTAVAAAPNGSRVYGVSGGALYDLGSLASVRLMSSPAADRGLSGAVLTRASSERSASGVAPAETVARGIQKIVLSDSGRYVMLSGDGVLQGWLSGPAGVAEVHLGTGAAGSRLAATDIALSSSGRTLFAVSAARSALYKIDLDHAGSVETAALSFEPTAVALVSPEAGQAAGTLQQVTSPQLTVAGGKTFTLDVKALSEAGAPQANITVFASSITPGTPTVDCLPDVTGSDGVGSLYCTAGAVASSTLVRITASDTTGRTAPSFEVTVAPPTATEGLAKTGGDFEVVPENYDFQLVVAASVNRVAQAGLSLTVTSVPTRPTVTCPPQVTTGANGQATIQCRSGVVSVPGEIKNPTDVEITVTDGTRSVVFSITIDPNKTLREGLSKISGDGQKVAQGIDLPFPLVVRSVVDGAPLVNERVTVSVNNTMALMCPIFAFTDDDGFAFIRCKGGTVFGESLVLVTVGGPRGSQVQFTVTVRASSSGIATKLTIVTTDPIQAVVGEVRPNAVRVIASDDSGQRVAGKKVFFESTGGVTFDPAETMTDGLGEASTNVTFGCANRNRGTISVGFAADETEDEIDFRLSTGSFGSVQKLQGDNQTGAPGQTLSTAALLVQVGDICGNPISNQHVNWRANPEARATFRNVVDTTNPSGRSSVLVQLGSYGGPFTVTAQAGEVVATFNLTVALEPSQLRRLSGDGQTATPGSAAPQPLVVEVLGTNGFGVSNVDVSFSVTNGTATLSRPASKSDGLGLAYTNVTLGAQSGPVTVTATAIDKSVTFTIEPGEGGGGPTAPLEGFVNGASFRAGWVPGSLGSIFGTGITHSPGVMAASAVPFPTSLDGVSVTVNGIAAPIISLINLNGQEQINLQVPFGVQAPGKATVVINNNGASVTVNDVPLLRAQPGIFEFNLNGTLLAAALHGDFSVVTPDNPAQPGEIIQLFLTGLGPTDPAVATNAAGPVPAARTVLDPVVGLDNAGAENFGGYYAPTLVTAYQVNFRVPDNAQSGNRELNVVVDGVSSQKSLLPVQRP